MNIFKKYFLRCCHFKLKITQNDVCGEKEVCEERCLWGERSV